MPGGKKKGKEKKRCTCVVSLLDITYSVCGITMIAFKKGVMLQWAWSRILFTIYLVTHTCSS